MEESEDTDDNIINEDMHNFHELGSIHDSSTLHQNTIVDESFHPNAQRNNSLLPFTKSDKSDRFKSFFISNRISENFENETQIEDIDENFDAKPEKFKASNQMNMTLIDDVWVEHLFGKKTNDTSRPNETKITKFFDRILHPMEYGTIRAGVFGLSSLCLEAGAMVLGIRCEQFGLVNFIILLILGGLLAYWCLVMMIKAGRTTGETSYSKVVKIILGNKVGTFMDTIITIDLFGELISFQVIIYQTLGAVIYDIMKMAGTLDEEKYSTFSDFNNVFWKETAYLKYPIMLALAGFVFPLCLLKDLSKMKIPSTIGVLALIYAMIVVLVESFFFMINENLDKVDQINWIDLTKAFQTNKGIPFFGGTATVFYLYSCHAGAFPVFKTLENNTTRRINTVFWRSILLDIVFYVIIATASFITSPIDSPDIILYRQNLSGFDPDYFILLAKFGLIFNTFFSTPANYEVFRLSFFELVWGNTIITDKKNIIVTATVLVLVTIIGAVYDQILEYFELIGGFCTVIYCIFIPGLIYAQNPKIRKSKFMKYFIIGFLGFIVAIGYTSGILTILFKMANITGDYQGD